MQKLFAIICLLIGLASCTYVDQATLDNYRNRIAENARHDSLQMIVDLMFEYKTNAPPEIQDSVSNFVKNLKEEERVILTNLMRRGNIEYKRKQGKDVSKSEYNDKKVKKILEELDALSFERYDKSFYSLEKQELRKIEKEINYYTRLRWTLKGE